MEKGAGPHLPEPLVDPSHMSRLNKNVDIDKELGYLFEAITLTRKGLDGRVPLIGFCGAPWTLMAYMVEGGGSRNYEKAKGWLYKYPKESMELLMRVADVCADMLVGQVLAGAQVSRLSTDGRSRLTNRCSRYSILGQVNSPHTNSRLLLFPPYSTSPIKSTTLSQNSTTKLYP
jgi:uroporphyrinogen decarboxylase